MDNTPVASDKKLVIIGRPEYEAVSQRYQVFGFTYQLGSCSSP